MTGRVVEVSSAARLSLQHRQLVIAREDGSTPSVPIEDLGLLIVDSPSVTYTHALLAALAEGKVATIICGRDHLPAGTLLPYGAHALSGERLRAQLSCPRPLAKRLWQSIIRSKLQRQGALLSLVTGSDAGLTAMAGRVRSGDPDNLEAQGAQRYWPRLLGSTFRRGRGGSPPNVLLDYGYAILRAATGRALVGAGLLPGLGVFHSNRGDAFALASDLMEPFRPFLDGVVWELASSGMGDDTLDRARKAHLLASLHLDVTMDGQSMPLSLGLQRAAAAMADSFLQKRCVLRLPSGSLGLPGRGHADPSTAP